MMPSVNIQFHMLFEELVNFVADISKQYKLEIELEKFFPQTFQIVSVGTNLTEEIKQFGPVDRFWLLYKSPKSKKTEKFMLNVGRQRGNQLAQAQFGAGTNKANAFEVLKLVATDLKKRTKAGVWVVGATGVVGFAKEYRISEGAAIEDRKGKIDLVGIGFAQSFHVDPPEVEDH